MKLLHKFLFLQKHYLLNKNRFFKYWVCYGNRSRHIPTVGKLNAIVHFMIEAKTNIQLIFRRQDFEDIYFKKNQGNIFFGESVKQYFVILLLFVTVFIISLTYSLFRNVLWGFPIFFLMLSGISSVTYASHASPIIKWKKQVIKYLNDLAKIKKYEIALTNDTLIMIQDDEETIIKWVTFTKAILNDESITLFGTDTYFFPKKSMDPSDYKYLKGFISDKLKNEL